MKKILLSVLILASIAGTAVAKSKGMKSKGGVCTPKGCPAGMVDHSYDGAYNANWQATPATADAGATTTTTSDARAWTRSTRGDTYYTFEMPNVTVRSQYSTGVSRPSAYEGDDALSYDGAAKNAYRNMNYNKTSEPLAATDGSK